MRPASLPVRLLLTFVMLAIAALGCGDNIKPIREDGGRPDAPPDVALSNAKALTAFSFLAANNTGLGNDVTATINGTAIAATVPFGVSVTALVATFTSTGTSVKVGTAIQLSGATPNNFSNPVAYTVTAQDGSTQVYTVTVTTASSTAKAITEFSFLAADNTGNLTADVTASISGTTIAATVPFNTNVTALVASFTTTGVSVKVGTTVQVSGTTANNFTSAVQYTVTAADNSTQVYTVTVTVAANSAKAITAFSFETINNGTNLAADVPGVINGFNISATVPFGTNVTALVATFATTGATVTVGGTAQTSGTTPNNYTSAVQYVVTAANNSTQTYTVTISIAPNTAKAITAFSFQAATNSSVLSANAIGTISGTSIEVIVPFGTVTSNLIATFTHTGASVTVANVTQTSGQTPNDFSNSLVTPVVYRVIATDNSFVDYTVRVNNSLPTAKDILTFEILDIPGIFNGTNITVTVPNGTPVTALMPSLTISGVSVSPADGAPQNFTNPVVYTVRAADTTTKQYTVTVIIAGTSDKDITSFTINGLAAVITNTSATAGTISINMPNGTDLVTLAPDVTINGVSVSPTTGATTDFSNGTVNYVVTAQDGTTKTYEVDVGIVNGGGTKLISSFVITVNGVAYQGSISNGAMSSTVTLELPVGTDLSAQTPVIVINGSSLSPASGATQNFTSPVTYVVTAADGSTRTYTVTVTATLL